MAHRAVAALAVAALALAGCGGSDESAVTSAGTTTVVAPTTETGPVEAQTLRVYLLRDGKVGPVARAVPKAPVVARMALTELLGGPSPDESALGFSSAIPGGFEPGAISISGGVADVELIGDARINEAGLAQIVYTLTQFPTVTSVSIRTGDLDLDARTRADFEAQTPQILVESPLPGDVVQSPIRVTGTANTFEANVVFNVLDAAGERISETFTTATSGNGVRGTYDHEISLPGVEPGPITLVAFEGSAEDGRPINVVELPLKLGP